MISMTNQVQLIGNIGQDIEMRTISNGSTVASISLATSEFYKNKNGEGITNTQWHKLVAWGNTAKYMSEQLHKGSKVAVRGSLSYETYVDKNNITRYTTKIKVAEFVRLSPATTSSPVIDPSAAIVNSEASPF